jgi:hypothetical protein
MRKDQSKTGTRTSRYGYPLPPILEFKIDKPGVYSLDILNASEWASLSRIEEPIEYNQHNPDTFIRLSREVPKA